MDDQNYTLRSTERDGTIRETELTAEQAFDLGAGKPIDDGRITRRESAIPERRADAA